MTALLWMTGLLLAASGLVKLRSGHRAGLGVHPLTVAELIAAFTWCWVAATGLGGTPGLAWLVPLGVVLVLASSALFSMRMREHRKRRAGSEARRLEVYVKYLSGDGNPPNAEE